MKRLLLILLVTAACLGAAAREMYVVSVGVADYAYLNDLRKAEKDAADIGALFRTHTKNVYVLTGRNATRAAVIQTMSAVFSRAKSDDVVVFFFSGHGSEGGMCVYETGGPKQNPTLSYKDVQGVLRQCKAKTKLLFVDACHSGGARAGSTPGLSSNWNTMANKYKVMLFLSSRTGETSLESAAAANGMFTTHLLRGLKGGADSNKDRVITARELFVYVSQKVQSDSRGQQHPVMWGKFDDNLCVISWNRK